MRLRDHDSLCEHGATWTHPDHDAVLGECPGGAEITLDFEAAAEAFKAAAAPETNFDRAALAAAIYGAVGAYKDPSRLLGWWAEG